jgi:von Willebrand factor A domain-containing protein 7
MNTSQIGLMSLCAVLLSAETLLAFKPGIHTDITKAALATTSRTLEGKTLRFTAPAMEAVAGANYDTDCGGDQDCRCYACQADPSRHFDNESFSTSSLRLVNLKESIIANITAPSPAGFAARQALGQALHTLQDFYAHSTWIHTRHTSFNPKLGRQVLDPLGPSGNDLASASAQTCDDTDHATLTSPVGTSEVTTGYFLPADFSDL